MELKEVVVWQTLSGTPLLLGETRITPLCRVLRIRLPFGGFVWNTPQLLLVERAGRTERLTIHDRTRQAQVVLLGLTLIFALAQRWQRRQRKENC